MDKDETKEQLLNELEEMRQRIKELEASETERKRAEETLKESEEEHKTVLENIQSLKLCDCLPDCSEKVIIICLRPLLLPIACP